MSSYKKKNENLFKSYQFKLQKDERIQWLRVLTTKAARKLLDEIWSEEWLTDIGETNHLKAYKVINEAKVQLEEIYLPSRIRRGVTEWVGEIMRGQYDRMICYYDCLKIVNWLGIETKESKLIAVVKEHYHKITQNGKKYYKHRKVIVKQTIQMIKKWHEKIGDFALTLRYIDLVKPRIRKLAFPFGPDDNQAIQYEKIDQKITLKMKIPITPQPQVRSDWEWLTNELAIPDKLQIKIQRALLKQPRRPVLITKTLKSGSTCFFLQFPWEYRKAPKRNGKERALAADFGLKKLATCIIGENGKQVSKAIIIKLLGSQFRHVERLYEHIAGIQKKLAKLKKQNRAHLGLNLEEERRRLFQKRNRLGKELAYSVANKLIEIALKLHCTKIVIEDLRDYKPPRGKRSWSRRLSEWLRGRIALNLEFKCQENGLTLQKVCPWNTSTHCPRCTVKGLKVKGPNNLTENKCGRFFHCPQCGFTADRDYIAAVNIYRASFIDYQEIKSLKDTSPVPYMDSGIHHSTVLSGGSEMIRNGIVAVTGYG